MNTIDRQYEVLLADVLKHGVEKKDRTGVGTLSVFGRQLRYNLNNGFPRITTKFVPMKAVKGELLWFLSGDTNIKWLKDHGISIWDEWADADGNLGPVYGHQWRSWPAPDGKGIDQINEVVERSIRTLAGISYRHGTSATWTLWLLHHAMFYSSSM